VKAIGGNIVKTICVMNLKGGVGKTVTADNMAAILAHDHGKRVLLVDADHQGNTTSFFGSCSDGLTLLDILRGRAPEEPRRAIQTTGYPELDLLPANIGLAILDATPEASEGANLLALRELLEQLAEEDAYDFAIIDMPPAFSFAARAALLAADEVIIPIKLDAFSVDGMAELVRQINSMRRVNFNLRLAGVLITMWASTDMMREAEEVLRAGTVPVYRTVIRRSDMVDESTFSRYPLIQYSPRSAACVDYRRFVAEYLGGKVDG
jgi:chromosome partitioning protein